MDVQKEAWEKLYRGQPRAWRGVADIRWISVGPGDRVLDLGCGNGKTSAALMESGAAVTGADFSEAAVESCRRLFGGRGTFAVADARDLPFADGSFDSLVAVHVLEHVPEADVRKAVSEIGRVVRKGGRIYLRCFAEGDMRSEGKKEDLRNGILYRYFSEKDVLELFGDYTTVSMELVEEPTRFGTVRRRWECILTV